MRKQVRCSASLRCAFVALTPFVVPAMASAQDTSAEDVIEEIITTGSYIPGSSEVGALPIDVVDRSDIEAQGAPTTADIVNDLVINTGSENRSNALGGQNRNTGTANINLRGLGLDKTLVLFNGKRNVIHSTSAGSGASFVDINLLPSIAIERIEVLKDGAAATYGSDAVAGVVNFITRKQVDGLELQASYRNRTDSASAAAYDISGIWGWSSARSNFVISGVYTGVEQMVADEVDWTVGQLDANRGVSTLAGPGALILTPDFADPNQVTNLTNYIGSFGAAAPLAQALIQGGAPNIDPNCADNDGLEFNILGTTATLPNTLPEFGRCGYSFVEHFNLQDEQERINVWATFETAMNDNHTFYAEAGYYKVDVSDIGNSPSFPVLRFEVIPAENPGNWLGVDGIYLGRPYGQNQPTSPGYRNYETYRFVGGFEGEFGDSWRYDTSVSYSSNNVDESSPTVLQQQFSDGLDGFGGPDCDPATGTPGTGNCFWFNPFSTRFFDPALANDPSIEPFMRSSNDLDQTATLLVVDAVFTRDLWDMSGGTVQGAFGFQYRDESLKNSRNPEALIPNNFIFVGGGTEINESQDVYALFGEIKMPLGDTVELQAALRYEDYGSFIGDTIDPKLALLWQATDTLGLRASASTTFRAPTLHQRFNQETNLIPLVDVSAVGVATTGFKGAETTGNPDLSPETATTYNVGLVLSDLGGFDMTLDYWSIQFEDVIAVQNAQTKVSIENALCPLRTPDCRDPDIIRNPLPGEDPDDNLQASGEISKVIVPFINAPTVDTSGIDIRATYAWDTSNAGSIILGLEGSYMFDYDLGGIDAVVGGEVTTISIDAVGNRNEQNIATSLPQFRANVFLDWVTDRNNVRVVMRHIDEYNDDKTVDQTFNETIDAFTTFDAFYTYTFRNDATSLHFNVINIADEEPPFADQDLNFDARIHNPFGRQYQVVFRHSFGN